MIKNEIPVPGITLNEIIEQFEQWRNTRKSRKPIPEKLWESAVTLTKDHSIHKISKALRLNYADLKKRSLKEDQCGSAAEKQTNPFIKLDLQEPSSISECIVEMEDGSGSKMRMHFRGDTAFDLLELGKSFWRRGS